MNAIYNPINHKLGANDKRRTLHVQMDDVWNEAKAAESTLPHSKGTFLQAFQAMPMNMRMPYPLNAASQLSRLPTETLSLASSILSMSPPSLLEPTPIGPQSSIHVVTDITPAKVVNSNDLYECLRPLLSQNPTSSSDLGKEEIDVPDLSLCNDYDVDDWDPLFDLDGFEEKESEMQEVYTMTLCSSSLMTDPLPPSLSEYWNEKAKSATQIGKTEIKKSSNQAAGSGAKRVRLRASHLEQWEQRYKELLNFQKQHGHCLVPLFYPANPRLAHWIKRQRCQYKLKLDGKHSTLTDERQTILEDLGFIWDSHHASWEEKFQELCEFKRLHGHCFIPTTYPKNPQLAAWIKCQRRQLRLYHGVGDTSPESINKPMKVKSTLSAERANKLLEIGLRWKKKSRTNSATKVPTLSAE